MALTNGHEPSPQLTAYRSPPVAYCVSTDKCIYVRRTAELTIITIVHVDDIIIGASDKKVLLELGAHFGDVFQVRIARQLVLSVSTSLETYNMGECSFHKNMW